MARQRVKRKTRTKSATLPLRGLADKVALAAKFGVKEDTTHKFSAGDTVKVHVRIKEGDKERIQVFEGTVIARRIRGPSSSFIVRKISHGVGVERIFLENSKRIEKIEVVQSGKVRRAKLYYLRDRQGRAAKLTKEQQTTE